MMAEVLESVRPRQWYKNLVVFAGLLFSGNIFSIVDWELATASFVVLCMLSGALYLLNDLVDAENDRANPLKRGRPIASGRLSENTAMLTAMVLALGAGLLVSAVGGWRTIVACAAFLACGMGYTFVFKRHFALDAIAIGVGFVLRVAVGCAVISVLISPWLIACVFLLAVYMAVGKRKYEARQGYDSPLVDNMLAACLACSLCCYVLYTVDVRVLMMATIPFVFYGLFKYHQGIYSGRHGDSNAVLAPQIVGCIAAWIIVVIVVLYVLPIIGV